MKFLTALLIALVACATVQSNETLRSPSCPDSLALAVSPAFVLCLPLDFYRNAVVVSADDLLLKRGDGSYFFAKVILPEMDDLPPDFDMREYPRHLLGLADSATLPLTDRARFEVTRDALQHRLDLASTTVSHIDGKQVYLIPGQEAAEVYITKEQRADQILLLGFKGFDALTIQTIIQGVR